MVDFQRRRVPLTPEQRMAIVQRIAELSAALHHAQGDSPTDGDPYGEYLRGELRSLALPLWLNGIPSDDDA